MNLFMMLLLWACVLLVPPSLAALHPISPCSSVFSYEGAQPEDERWYGIVLLSTDESLVGVRIDVRLDRRAEILVSWMGTVTTDDNERFTILSLDQKLHPGPPIPSRFMVKFNAVKGSPQVRTIRLNGRQICPPDPNFPVEVQPSNQDHLYENRFTTERITRRPDLDFDEDWTNSRPVNPVRPNPSDNYKPPKRQNTEENVAYNSGGYNSQANKNPGGYAERETVRTTTYSSYDSHESHHGRPNYTRPSVSEPQPSQNSNPRPLGTEYTGYSTVSRPSINININKDVTYSVERPETLSYNGGSGSNQESGGNRPSSGDRDPSYQHTKPTERYNEQSSSGVRDEYHGKPTTKKPVVYNSINININSGDNDNPSNGPSYNSGKITTRRPYVSGNKNSTSSSNTNNYEPSNNNRETDSNNNNRITTRKPTVSGNQRPSSNNGYQSNRPNRNPDLPSSEPVYQPEYSQNGYNNNERTTEKSYQSNSNQQSSNEQRPVGTDSVDNSRPSAIPSSRPSGGGGNKKIPRPQTTSGSKYGEEGELEVANSNVKCGRVEVNPAPLITHGQNTARGQWPWHIALYRIEGINLSYSCGGSLISSTIVITAAHCVTKAPRDRPVDADILVVQLGKYHLYQFSDDSVQNKQVKDVHVHPRYNSSNYLDDVAVLVLSSPAEFTKFVRPVCLWPRHNFNLPSLDNKEGTVVGWGYDENNQVTEELKMARMPVVSYVICLKSYPQFFSQFTAENKTFCAGFRQGTSVCNGDSGGGMVFQQDNIWYLRGLVSITVAKQGLRVCDTNHYVVFTDIANYIDWIGQYIS